MNRLNFFKKIILNKNLNQKSKILCKYFISIFLITFLFWNWHSITLVFNYRIISNFVSEHFNINNLIANQAKFLTESKNVIYLEKENMLLIPKIQVQAPLVFSLSNSTQDIENALNKGTVFFPNSVMPGEKGKVIILGHSAPVNWPKINYDNVFDQLNKLEKKDEIIIYFENKEYRYQVKQKSFVVPGTELTQITTPHLTNTKNMLFLISCWPPGSRKQRIVIKAKQLI